MPSSPFPSMSESLFEKGGLEGLRPSMSLFSGRSRPDEGFAAAERPRTPTFQTVSERLLL